MLKKKFLKFFGFLIFDLKIFIWSFLKKFFLKFLTLKNIDLFGYFKIYLYICHMEGLTELYGFGKLILGYLILLFALVLSIKDIRHVKKVNFIITLFILAVGFILWTFYALTNFF